MAKKFSKLCDSKEKFERTYKIKKTQTLYLEIINAELEGTTVEIKIRNISQPFPIEITTPKRKTLSIR